MRIALSVAAGIIVGYSLHARKDETVDEIANSISDFFERRKKSMPSLPTYKITNR